MAPVARDLVRGATRVPRLHLGVLPDGTPQSTALGERRVPAQRGCGARRRSRRLPGGAAPGRMGRSRAVLRARAASTCGEGGCSRARRGQRLGDRRPRPPAPGAGCVCAAPDQGMIRRPSRAGWVDPWRRNPTERWVARDSGHDIRTGTGLDRRHPPVRHHLDGDRRVGRRDPSQRPRRPGSVGAEGGDCGHPRQCASRRRCRRRDALRSADRQRSVADRAAKHAGGIDPTGQRVRDDAGGHGRRRDEGPRQPRLRPQRGGQRHLGRREGDRGQRGRPPDGARRRPDGRRGRHGAQRRRPDRHRRARRRWPERARGRRDRRPPHPGPGRRAEGPGDPAGDRPGQRHHARRPDGRGPGGTTASAAPRP